MPSLGAILEKDKKSFYLEPSHVEEKLEESE